MLGTSLRGSVSMTGIINDAMCLLGFLIENLHTNLRATIDLGGVMLCTHPSQWGSKKEYPLWPRQSKSSASGTSP